jgi:serine/threonine-protein kinase
MGMNGFLRVLDLDRGTDSQLTTEGMSEFGIWTPDGRRVVFDWVATGAPNLFWQPVDGSSPPERLTQSKNIHFPASWSPDGQTLAFSEIDANADAGYDIVLLHIADRRVTPFLNSRFSERNPQISPDGHWIAYESNESGREEVYVRPFPGAGGKWQVSGEGGYDPLWARDGRELFYRKDGAKRATEVYAVDIRTGPEFSIAKPRLLFTGPDDIQRHGVNNVWDITPDGKRFLMVKRGERKAQPVTELVLVQNWFEEIRRLVPTGKK